MKPANAVATFGALTGDYSRIHFDHELGRASPHGRGFAHGLLSASWALGGMTLEAPERLGCGEADAYLASFAVRFHDVVRFGDTRMPFFNRTVRPSSDIETNISPAPHIAQDIPGDACF